MAEPTSAADVVALVRAAADAGLILAPKASGHGASGDTGDRVTGRKPFTFLGAGESAASAFAPAALDRLRAVKRQWDPHGRFRSNFPVGAGGS